MWAKEQSGEADFNHSERDLWNNAEFQKSTEFPPQRSIVAQSILLDQFLVAGHNANQAFIGMLVTTTAQRFDKRYR